MPLIKWMMIAVIAFITTGCATPYQSHSLGGGFKDTKIDDKTWRVSFHGNGYTNKDMVWNYWIYRCAALTIEQGFTGMLIETNKKTSSMDRFGPDIAGLTTLPPLAPALAHYNIHTSSRMPLGSDNKWSMMKGPFIPSSHDRHGFQQVRRGGGGYSYYYVPGQTITTWHAEGTVHMFNENTVPAGATAWIRAATIVELLKPYVDSRGEKLAPSREHIISSALVPVVPGKSL